MKKSHRFTPTVERFEDRVVPTFNFAFDGLGNLTVTGVPNGAVSVTLVGDGTYLFDDADPAGPHGPFFAPGNLTLNYATSGSDDTISIVMNDGGTAFSIPGNLTINTGGGADSVGIDGFAALGSFVGGNITMNGTNSVLIDTVNVGGNVLINAAMENLDGDYMLSDVIVGGNYTVFSGNGADNFSLTGFLATNIGGSVYLSGANDVGLYDIQFGTTIGRNLTIIGGNFDDTVVLDTAVGGNTYINLGGATTINSLSVDGAYGGAFTYLGGSGADSVAIGGGFTGAQLFGNVYMSLGEGDNQVGVAAAGMIGGPSFTLLSGSGADTVSFAGTFFQTRLFASLGAGADSVSLDGMADLTFLFIDFGAGADTFASTIPLVGFPAFLFNL